MTVNGSAPSRTGVVRVAFYTMLVFGVLTLIAGLANPSGLVQGMLYLIAAWGIRRGRAWSAYGLALLTLVLTGIVLAGGMLDRELPANVQAWSVRLGLWLNAAIVVLLFFAGRALERSNGRRGLAWPWIAASVVAGGFFALFGLYQTPTGSMEDTLLVGDRIAVLKTHGKVPARGEVVVHLYPVNRKDTFIKRVVGIPGDRIRIVNKQLFVNGTVQAEPYVVHRTSYMDAYRDNFPGDPNVPLYPGAKEMLAQNVVNGEVVVPPGRYFVMGDNRDSSLDSRYWGFIEQADIIGTPEFVYYSVYPEQSPLGEGKKLALPGVRWGRIFRSVS